MRVTVAIVTYKRSWALPFSLASIAQQTRRPDEVVVVLKPSGDGSEEVVSKFSHELPLRLVIQEEGNFTDAVSMAIANSSGDVIAFLDDDAVAEEKWVEKYMALFADPRVGGASGVTLKAYMREGFLEKTLDEFYDDTPTRYMFYRRPLPEYSDYVGWISISGFMGMKALPSEGIFKSVLLGGVNMAWRREAVADCPLAALYRRSRKGLWFEQLLAYCAKRRGFDTYGVRGSQAPIVWHIAHEQSLTRGRGFWHEFWVHYDRVANYWRLKKLGARASLAAYLAACLAMLRKKPLPRLAATLYTWVARI